MISKVIVDPMDPRNLYIAVVGANVEITGIWKLTIGADDTQTWVKLTDNAANKIGRRIEVTDLDYTVDANGNLFLYAGVRNTGDAVGGVWRSTDGGSNWFL
jgi:hypothetical protein